MGNRSDWKEMTDKKTGKKFYYNVKTRKTQWEKACRLESKRKGKQN